jgi:hypothetical protein
LEAQLQRRIRLRVRALLENGNSGLNPCPKI